MLITQGTTSFLKLVVETKYGNKIVAALATILFVFWKWQVQYTVQGIPYIWGEN